MYHLKLSPRLNATRSSRAISRVTMEWNAHCLCLNHPLHKPLMMDPEVVSETLGINSILP
jgi:hypothetical protein